LRLQVRVRFGGFLSRVSARKLVLAPKVGPEDLGQIPGSSVKCSFQVLTPFWVVFSPMLCLSLVYDFVSSLILFVLHDSPSLHFSSLASNKLLLGFYISSHTP